jgi:Ala-tRNA(Pro) deacylase
MDYYIIKSGRPADMSDRPEKERRVYDLLDKLKIDYTRIDHEALETMEACIEVDKTLNVHMCKNLFLCNSQRTQFYLLLMPGEKKFITKDLSRQIGSARLSFAEKEYMEKYLDITPGSVSVMGLMNDKDRVVRLLIDSELMKEEYIACHPCINTTSIKLKTEDILDKFLPYTGHEPTIVNL